MTMTIRPLTKRDETAFQDIMKEAIRVTCAGAYGEATVAAWVSGDNPAFHFSIPEFAFVAQEKTEEGGENEGEIMAVGGWTLTDRVDLHPVAGQEITDPTHARINAVYVKPGCEGRGLGSEMVDHLEADIRVNSALCDIYLWSTKNAIPFYEAQGYRPGKDEFPEVAPGHKVLVRYMWKRLG